VDASAEEGSAVAYSKVQTLLQRHCLMCHSATPAVPAYQYPPAGVALETPQQLARFAPRVMALTVLTQAMPPGNLTAMTDEERDALGEVLRQYGFVQ
jgi:uncharacterized membrane protein